LLRRGTDIDRSESLGQAPRQLAVYGRDGLPVVSPDGHRLEGWDTQPPE
ncbi:MAG: hypothetical protein QOH87_3829, partial [Trebonia sp.]|nr:hypothetical protein [Trebonia sp.]